jgi:hypothetical protein
MRKYYSILNEGGTGGGGDPNKLPPPQPKGYTPLTVQNRSDWNGFLDYLDKQKLGGNPVLDKRDQTLGLQQMAAYKKANPNFSITPEMIPNIQYEQYQLRKGDSFPGLKPEELQYMRNGLSPAYMARPVSDPDAWLGSLTSKEYYPTATRADNHGNKYSFGVNFEDYVRSLSDPSIQEKYKVKPSN